MNRTKLRKILDSSDIVTQMVVAIEELSELQKELTKYIRFFRGKGGDYYIGNLIEEMADVLIMVEQIKLFFGIMDMEIEVRAEEKIDRRLREIE